MRVAGTFGLLLLMVGCARAEPPASASPAPVPTIVARFCAHGGVGLTPVPTPPEFESQFVTVVVDVDNPSSDIPGVAVRELVLLDAAGGVDAPLRRVDHVVVLAYEASPPLPSSDGGWAYYLNPPGKPFTGTLPKGVTRLRVRASLKNPPRDPVRFRLQLMGPAAPLVVEGKVDGAWPT
jgi:hypothetical protein